MPISKVIVRPLREEKPAQTTRPKQAFTRRMHFVRGIELEVAAGGGRTAWEQVVKLSAI